MDRIYEHADDLHVRATYIYAKASDAYAYADSGKTVKIPASDLKNLFHKGVIIVDGTVEYAPVSCEVSSTDVGTITYVKTDATTATTAKLATLKSKEYSAT